MKPFALFLAIGLLAVLVVRLSWRSSSPVSSLTPAVERAPRPLPPAPVAKKAPAPSEAERVLAELRARNAALERELAAAKEQGARVDTKGPQLTFTLGTLRESGRTVGLTLRRDLEAAMVADPEEARRMREENRLNLLSLGPYIREAEAIEADPVKFAEFQGELVSEILGLEERHNVEVEVLLEAFKAESQRVEMGSPVWVQLDRGVQERITALMPAEQREARRAHLKFFEDYGMLLIPAYVALKEPTR